MKKKKIDFFWASYADLMTSLFFIMLVLFILTVVFLKREQKKLEAERGSFQIKAEQFDKITEIEESINQIDKTFFSYDPENKKHILNLQIRFASESYSMSDVPYATQSKLREVGRIISNFVKDAHEKK